MNNYLILVAEDERDIRDLIVFTLQINGFSVVGVPDGKAAVKKATEIKPDLILLDVRMPRMTGLEACRVLKQQESTRDIPVIFLSAKGQAEDIKAGLQMGAEAYFLKPFAPEELPRRILKILDK